MGIFKDKKETKLCGFFICLRSRMIDGQSLNSLCFLLASPVGGVLDGFDGDCDDLCDDLCDDVCDGDGDGVGCGFGGPFGGPFGGGFGGPFGGGNVSLSLLLPALVLIVNGCNGSVLPSLLL